MRLVDADALKDKAFGGRKGLVHSSDIDAAPTIDAIPVEWLIDRANDPERAPLYRRYAQMLYEEWQKEQEGQDG